jgi:hypothetical protein
MAESVGSAPNCKARGRRIPGLRGNTCGKPLSRAITRSYHEPSRKTDTFNRCTMMPTEAAT